ncbi:MAG TPA: type I-C CRISPR-associated protein Cas5c [Nitrospira sp.]|nr:type I-C CRISPR-associated protein Cas5c [Nitrospira sp.]
MSKSYCLEVSGDFACFTRPEMKVERVSCDVMTPSAARAVFEAIVWKPAIRWRVIKIEVLKPIKWISVRRNEVGAVVSTRNVQAAMSAGSGELGLHVEDERQQRAGLFLRDVTYRIHAYFELRDPSFHKSHSTQLSKVPVNHEEDDLLALSDNNATKFMSMFERRASRGQCVNQPYLGCREFACSFRFIEDVKAEPKPIEETKDLGWMLYDLDYSNPADPKPRFFKARLDNGVVMVPAWESEEVRG